MYSTDQFEEPTWRRGVLTGVTHSQLLRWLGEAVGVRRKRSFYEDPRKADRITTDPPEEAGEPAPRGGVDHGLVIAVALGLIVGGIVAAVLIATA